MFEEEADSLDLLLKTSNLQQPFDQEEEDDSLDKIVDEIFQESEEKTVPLWHSLEFGWSTFHWTDSFFLFHQMFFPKKTLFFILT